MKKLKGFTLLELMVTIAIAVVLLTLAAPSFQELIRNNRTTTQANELITAFNLSRSEAIEQSEIITVCSSTDQIKCAGSKDWATGWIVFTDKNGDQIRDGANCGSATIDDCLIRVWGPVSGSAILTASASFIEFTIEGLVNPSLTQTFTLKASSSCGTNDKRVITVTATGRTGVDKNRDC